jgi:hypothetical protein
VHQAFFTHTKESNQPLFLFGARILAGVQNPEGKAYDPFLPDSAIGYSYL